MLISIASVAFAFRVFLVPFLASLYPNLEPVFYDWAVYGPYPTQSYVSFNLSSPRPSVQRWNESCADGLILQDLHGAAAPTLGPYITDSRGNLVWLSDQYGFAANLNVQRYQDQEYLTFWAGRKLTESGQGMYYMLDSSYRVVHTVSAVGDGLYGDLHEFVITEDGTALMTIYDRTSSRLPASHPQYPEESIVDCVVQEVDIATGELLFEWRASDHLSDARYLERSFGDHVDGNGPLDYFHINSIEKDRFGNYLISVRHAHSLLYVNDEGTILWALGGDSSDFKDISDPPATDFHWQHDARWQELETDHGILTVFDNGVAKRHHESATYSQGRMIRLDFVNRTAELMHSYTSLDRTAAVSQGSMQVMPTVNEGDSDHVIIGWGSNAAFSEFTIDGELLCETHFASSLSFRFEGEKSYRAIKTTAWHGVPHWDPVATIQGGKLYVSWNGATEVEYWALQGMSSEQDPNSGDAVDGKRDEEFEDIDIIYQDGRFESTFDISANSNDGGPFTAFRVAALDADGNVLRYSNVAMSPQPWSWFAMANFGVIVVFLLSALLTAVVVLRRWRYGRGSSSSSSSSSRWNVSNGHPTWNRAANAESELEIINNKGDWSKIPYTRLDAGCSSDCVKAFEGIA